MANTNTIGPIELLAIRLDSRTRDKNRYGETEKAGRSATK